MIISVNWLKKFTDIDLTIDELANLIGSRLVEIEEIVDLGKKYENVIVAKVVECQELEGSDHLNVTKIDDGGVAIDVERDENGFVQVVCGAPNVYAGMLVAWLPPNSTVPETYNDKEPFVLGARKLRGVMSNGMLASAKELDLFDEHEGILEVDKNVQPGTSFAKTYELDDYLLDIENKSLTHRPDCFGLIGFAREVAAIQGKQFVSPDVLKDIEPTWIEKSDDAPTPNVTIDDPKLSDRYQAVVLTSVDAKVKSPLETQTYLTRLGIRPHSAVVDVTNYLMMLTGQPLHAFDYDKLKSLNDGNIDIHVRGGREGEKLTLLDGREIDLHTSDIVVANGETPVALAGAMGGIETEIDENSTNILLECATFNLFNLRNTQFRHGIFSEAITRFTKGQPAALTAPVLAEAVKLLSISAGAKRASEVADFYPNKLEPKSIKVPLITIQDVLGDNPDMGVVAQTLGNVEFEVDIEAPYIVIATPPYWRADIHIAEDIVEEIGRLNGYDSIKPIMPKRDFTAVSPSVFDAVRSKIRRELQRAGANEILSYSFVHEDLLKKVGQKPENAYRIVNSLSPELQYFRQSLIPSLLKLVHPNTKAGYDEFAVFELNKVHVKAESSNEELPKEIDQLALVFTSKKLNSAAYYDAKKYLEYLAGVFGVKLSYKVLEENPNTPDSVPFEYRRAAYVFAGEFKEPIGIVGEFKSQVIKNFKLPKNTAGFVINSSVFTAIIGSTKVSYVPASRYPGTMRDVCFQVEKRVNYRQVFDSAYEVLEKSDLETSIVPLDIYGEENSSTKNITLRVGLTSHEKTLTGDEVDTVIDDMISTVAGITGAKIV